MPDKYFKELQWLEVESEMGATISMRITTIARIPRVDAKCGSLLILVTDIGHVILDDTVMSFDHDVSFILHRAGFPVIDDAGPAMNALQSGRARKLDESIGVSITGFFNAIDDRPWSCSAVPKPRIPTSFTATTTQLTPCDPRVCKYQIAKHPLSAKPLGVRTVDGKDYMALKRRMFVNETDTVYIDTFNSFPGQRGITHINSMTGGRAYQLQYDGVISHCAPLPPGIQMHFPPDFNFWYAGEVPAEAG